MDSLDKSQTISLISFSSCCTTCCLQNQKLEKTTFVLLRQFKLLALIMRYVYASQHLLWDFSRYSFSFTIFMWMSRPIIDIPSYNDTSIVTVTIYGQYWNALSHNAQLFVQPNVLLSIFDILKMFASNDSLSSCTENRLVSRTRDYLGIGKLKLLRDQLICNSLVSFIQALRITKLKIILKSYLC